jgi:hypothetical protein
MRQAIRVTQAPSALPPDSLTSDPCDDHVPRNPLDWTEDDQPTYVPLSRTRRQADLITFLIDERDEALRMMHVQRQLRVAVAALLRRHLAPRCTDFGLGTRMCKECGGRAEGFVAPLVHADWCHIGRVEALLRV